ncbi:MAG: hypothetical protein JJT96_06005 [Opitutales bacterium]|nr:hypothetical protein [Opitutales bacterium]
MKPLAQDLTETERAVLIKEEFETLRKALLAKLAPEREDPLRQLSELFALYRKGALSESEYNDRKWTLLGRV